MSTHTAIAVDGLTKRFGDHAAVDGLTFELPTGGVTGFLGPNGSGKSTTIRMLLGLVRPTAGRGSVLGHPISEPKRYVGQVGALIDSPALYPTLSGRDALRVYAELGGVPAARIDAVLDIVGLADRAGSKTKTYSLGMKQRLAIAIALLRDPPLLVLDEPTNGLDPAGIVEMRTLIMSLGAAGHTVLVSSHVLAEMQAACDRFVVIREGRLLFAGSADDLMAVGPDRVTVRPERPDDLDALAVHLRERGFDVAVGDGILDVDASADSSAELNRISFEHGIVLRELSTRSDDLEDVFLHLTEEPAR
ncbi:MAG: ABC transporter ATP-binding protein [Microthrixaceae bacterium]|nr:ABC transporter ATP-binding protein [Microthrixaceae bacterium]